MNGIIVLDGPAGVGKSTLAKTLAQELQLPYLDTGAMFRFLACRIGENGVNAENGNLSDICSHWRFSLDGVGKETKILANGQPIGDEIRSEKAGILASALATKPEIREILRKNQQELGKIGPLVAEGRDLGTVVFPNADWKFFLDARPEIRANRRWRQLQEKGKPEPYEKILENIQARDKQDRNRPVAPLVPAPDAIIIDTSDLNLREVLARLLDEITHKANSAVPENNKKSGS